MKNKLIHKLKSLDIEKDTWSDNLAVVLATYFEKHMDRPEDDPEDSDFGWGVWVIEQTDKTFEYMAEQLMNNGVKL